MQELTAVISMRRTLPSLQQQDAGRTSEEIIREWIARFATNCGQVLSEARVLLWLDEFSRVEPERLEAAFGAVMRSHAINTIPQVGEIHALLDRVEQLGGEAEAEDAWAFALNYATKHYHPDLGVDRRAPELQPKIERAIIAAGGLRWLWGCPEEQLQWAKKSFVASLKNSAELERVADLLPNRSEARKLLGQWRAQSERSAPRSLAPAVAVVEAVSNGPLAPDDPIRAECAVLREKLGQPEPRPVMTSAELEARRKLLRRQAAEILEDTRTAPRKLAQAAPAVELKAAQ
jgi:hypothetical protein